MKKVIITGGTGFIGANLVKSMSDKGIEVYAVARPDSANILRIKHLPGVEIIEGDINNLSANDLPNDCNVFYHLAWDGVTGPGRGDYHVQNKSAITCLNAAILAKEVGCKKIVYTGTVYENLCESILEGNEFRGPSFYLISKKYAYDMLLQLSKKIDIDFVWCTFFHPVGKYMKVEQMAAYAIDSLIKGVSPSFGPALQPYDIVSVTDLAHGLILAGEKPLSKHRYCIGSTSPRILKQYLEEMRQIINPDVSLGIGDRPDDGLQFDFAWMDCTDFQKETGYAPKMSFEQTVLSVKDWLMQN